uniref:Adenylate cyclase N-terminal domain-containing protein n=1 Tax=Strigamia maritima TaxID=126957 RepID=T1JK57_STRMM
MATHQTKSDGELNKESNSVTNGIRLLELPDADRKPELRRDVTNLSIDQTGLQALLPSCMQVTFADRDVEALYKSYYYKERRRDLQCFLMIALFFAVFAIILQCFQQSDYLVTKILILAVIGLVNTVVLVLCRFFHHRLPSFTWFILPYITWFLYYLQVVCDGLLNNVSSKSGDFLPWFLLGTYMTYVFLPLRVQYCLLLNVVALGGHVIIAAVAAQFNDHVANEVGIIKKEV